MSVWDGQEEIFLLKVDAEGKDGDVLLGAQACTHACMHVYAYASAGVRATCVRAC